MDDTNDGLAPLTLLTLDDLSKILRRPRDTIRNDRVRNPQALPPAVEIPGVRAPLWRRQDVDAWLAAHVVTRDVAKPPQLRGRPKNTAK